MRISEQIPLSLVPAALFVASGILGLFVPLKAWMRGAILHLAAGVVFAVVAVELIPDILRDHRPIETVLGFSFGAAAMLGLRAFTQAKAKEDEKAEEENLNKVPLGMLAGVAIDLAIDGFMIGIGFAAGAKQGRLLAVALGVELVSLGFAVVASMTTLGIARRQAVGVVAGLATTFLAGSAVGVVLLSRLSSHWLAGVLSFGAAALLFLVTEELLREAHEERETPFLTALFFLGFLVFLVLGMLGG